MEESHISQSDAIEIFKDVARSGKPGQTPELLARFASNARQMQKPKVRYRHNQIIREQYKSLKVECIVAYGGKSPRCACCEIDDIRFLSLDHVNNDGSSHRADLAKEVGSKLKNLSSRYSGAHFYRHLKKAGFPKDPPLQVLCFNCNMGKQTNGGICPHKVPMPEFLRYLLR